MTRAVLSIGSNLGDRLALLQGAVDAMRPWLVAISPVYETAPWGDVEQDDFLNAILIVADPGARAATWLSRAHDAEAAAGRVRDVRWGPRTLDVDVIAVDAVVSDEPQLMLPHPRAGERAFVLVPWLAVDADATLGRASIKEYLAALPAADIDDVRLRADLVLA